MFVNVNHGSTEDMKTGIQRHLSVMMELCDTMKQE
jgi:hypothetical protein